MDRTMRTALPSLETRRVGPSGLLRMRQSSRARPPTGAGRRSGGPEIHANRVLTLLSSEDYKPLRPHLEAVTLEYRRPLYGANEPIKFVYFIESGVASLVNTMSDGKAAEVRSEER